MAVAIFIAIIYLLVGKNTYVPRVCRHTGVFAYRYFCHDSTDDYCK